MPTPSITCTAKRLAREQIDQAFPLVQLLAPKLSLGQWRENARALTQASPTPHAPHGIVVLMDAAGYFFGLFSYVGGLDLLHGPTLFVDNLVILHFVECGESSRLMEREMQEIARRLDCRSIQVRLVRALPSATGGGLSRVLAETGYRADGTTWWRTLPAAEPNRA